MAGWDLHAAHRLPAQPPSRGCFGDLPWLYVFAMGLHIFMLDNQLTERFERTYEPWGRVLLVACLVLGWTMGASDALPETITSVCLRS